MSDADSALQDAQARILELERENDRLRRQVEPEPKAPATERSGHSRGRQIISIVLVTVACLLAPLSVVSVWARGEVTDTSRYVATVAPLASNPAIQAAVENRINTEIFAYLESLNLGDELIGAIADNRDLTDRQLAVLNALKGPAQSGVRSLVSDGVTKIVQSPKFAELWVQINTQTHEELMGLLSGNSDSALSLQGNDVVLDVNTVLQQVKADLLAQGFTLADKIPSVNTKIVVFQGENIPALQAAYSALDALGFWLPIVAIALALIGVFVANAPRKALIGLGVGLTLAMIAAALGLVAGRFAAMQALPPSVDQAAAQAFFDQFTMFLRQSLWAGAAAGIVFLLAGIMIGPSTFARGVRRTADRAALAIQSGLASWGVRMTRARKWVAGQATGLRVGVSLIAVVFIMAQRYKTPGLVLWTTVVLLVVLFLIQIMASGVDSAETADENAAAPGSSA